MSSSPSRAGAVPEVSTAEVAKMISSGRTVQLIDVREPSEFVAGHIAGSVLLPLGDLTHRYREIDPDIPAVMICRSGRRSGIATQALARTGFSQVVNMAGGMLAWVKEGRGVEKGQ